MRVVSQDSKIDVAYDYGNLSVAVGSYEGTEYCAIYYYSFSSQRGTKLAEYSTEEKALKAMEMLRMAYVGTMLNVNCNITEDFESQLKQMMKNGFGVVCINSKENQCDFKPLNTVFQFPKDEDVEV